MTHDAEARCPPALPTQPARALGEMPASGRQRSEGSVRTACSQGAQGGLRALERREGAPSPHIPSHH